MTERQRESQHITHHASRITAPRATTDPQHELFDILDAAGHPTGERKPRWQVHRDGDWHAALHIWIGGVRDDGTLFVLFQRRSLTKDTWAGYLDVVVGGHLRAGESMVEAAREAEEEIGLTVTLVDLTPIGRRFVAGGRDGVIDRELQYIYAMRRDDPLSSYRLHPDEVSAIVAIGMLDAHDLFAGVVDSVSGSERTLDGQADEPIRLTRKDFAGTDDEYPLKSLAALAALLTSHVPTPFEQRSSPADS